MSEYEVISGPCFPVFNANIGKYRPEITPYLDTFQAVKLNHRINNIHESPFFDELLLKDISFRIHHSNLQSENKYYSKSYERYFSNS